MASTVVADASRSEPPSRSVDPSPSSSPDVGDRSDSSNSSMNNLSDNELQFQTPDVLKSEEYRQLFHLPPEEVLIEDFNCAIQENLLIQGHMYLFVNFICFYSNIFGYETKKVIPLPEVTCVRRAKTAGIFPNAIEIQAGNRKHFFASFLSRDEAFKIINDGWSRQGNGAIIMEQKESMSESTSQENGFVTVENVNISDIPDSTSVSTDLSQDARSPSIVGDVPVLVGDSEKQCSVQQVAELELNNDAPSESWKWNEEDIDAPSIDEAFTCVAEEVFPIKVEDFFRYFFSDDAVNFLESFHKKCGDKDFKCGSWHPQEKFGYARELSFQHPIKIYLGAKFGGCHEVQKFRVYKNSHLVVETSQEVSDVPYADYFRVEGLWNVERDKDESKECCIMRVFDEMLSIFRKGEEFNHGVEFVLLISFNEAALGKQAEHALASLASVMSESPSLIVQFTLGLNFSPSSKEYTHGVVIRFRSVEAFEIFINSKEYKNVWHSKFQPIAHKSLSLHFSVDPVGTEIM